MKYAVTLVTCRDARQGEAIARALVGEKLAACVNVLPLVRSIYRWKGKICRDAEALLVIKSRASLSPRVAARVKALHSYSVPEIIHLPIDAGHPAYLKWLGEATR